MCPVHVCIRVAHLRHGLLAVMMPRPYCGQQVHHECEDIEGEDESEDPLKDGGSIEFTLSIADTKAFKDVIREIA